LTARAAIALSFACLPFVAGNARAEDTRLHGVFVNRAPSDKLIKEAIDRSVASFNFVARPVARSRLKKSNPVITRAEFGRTGSDVVVKLGAQKPSAAAPGGPTVKWTRDDGETLDVSFAWDGATLLQSFKAEDGMRYNRYTLSSDGNALTVDVLLTSDRLEIPVKYQMTLTREIVKP
jgi:hypothetical protein